MKSVLKFLFCVSLLLVLSGCLKTRSQLKEDEGASNSAVKEPVNVPQSNNYVIDEIKQEITRLNGRIQELERMQSKADENGEGAQADITQKLENRVIELEQAQVNMLQAIKNIQNTMPVADQTELFETGKVQYQKKQYAQAIKSLTAYLGNPKGEYVEDATYLRGEAYYSHRSYKNAILDFSKFPEKYTRSKYKPAALYKIGLCFEALGSKEDATAFFAQLIDEFPKSKEAARARKKVAKKL